MVQIVPWRITDIEAGPTWDALLAASPHIGGSRTGRLDDFVLPQFTPTRDAGFLRDGNDATHVEVHDDYPGKWSATYGRLEPLTAIPSGDPEWVRITTRSTVTSGSAGEWIFGMYTWDGPPTINEPPDTVNEAGWFAQSVAPSGTVSSTFTFPTSSGSEAYIDPDPDLFGYFDASRAGAGAFDIFAAGSPLGPVWVTLDRPQVTGDPGSVRFHDVLVEVAYPGKVEFPLRQVQRDDHLAPGGAIRASTGTSRQGSIRARAYE